jgi:hypothetical protein
MRREVKGRERRPTRRERGWEYRETEDGEDGCQGGERRGEGRKGNLLQTREEDRESPRHTVRAAVARAHTAHKVEGGGGRCRKGGKVSGKRAHKAHTRHATIVIEQLMRLPLPRVKGLWRSRRGDGGGGHWCCGGAARHAGRSCCASVISSIDVATLSRPLPLSDPSLRRLRPNTETHLQSAAIDPLLSSALSRNTRRTVSSCRCWIVSMMAQTWCVCVCVCE